MKNFIIKRGGQVENPDEYLFIMTHYVDEELLKMAINKMAAKENVSINDIHEYLDTQFQGVQEIIKLNDEFTFYY